MNSILSDGDAEIEVESVGQTDQQSFVHRFGLDIGEVQVMDKDDEEEIWMWKVEDSLGNTCRSATIFDAVMGVIEKQSGGEL